MVKVYRYKHSYKGGPMEFGQRAGTLAAIKDVAKGTPIMDSAEEIDESELDRDGFRKDPGVESSGG